MRRGMLRHIDCSSAVFDRHVRETAWFRTLDLDRDVKPPYGRRLNSASPRERSLSPIPLLYFLYSTGFRSRGKAFVGTETPTAPNLPCYRQPAQRHASLHAPTTPPSKVGWPHRRLAELTWAAPLGSQYKLEAQAREFVTAGSFACASCLSYTVLMSKRRCSITTGRKTPAPFTHHPGFVHPLRALLHPPPQHVSQQA